MNFEHLADSGRLDGIKQVVLQARAALKCEAATGIDEISAEVYKVYPGGAFYTSTAISFSDVGLEKQGNRHFELKIAGACSFHDGS